MGLGRRILDLARANLNALLDQAEVSRRGHDESAVDDLTDEELRAELERRQARRAREEAERLRREGAEKAARERGAQQRSVPPATAQSPRTAAPHATTTTATTPKTRRAAPPKRPAPPPTKEQRLRALYQQLEVPYGASFDEVKRSFRRLMRKYHPDLHAGNPTKHRAATQLTMSLTQAYDELEKHLVKGRP